MEHKVARSVLTILLAAVAVFAIAEGILVLMGVRTPAVKYQGALFTDATVPMLLLAIVVGGSTLLAAATAFIHREWAVLVSVLACPARCWTCFGQTPRSRGRVAHVRPRSCQRIGGDRRARATA